MRKIIPTLCFVSIAIASGFAQNGVQRGEFIVEPPTLQNLGFEWYIGSDDRYRL